MLIKKRIHGILPEKGKSDTYDPPAGQSSRWKHRKTEQDPKVCLVCERMQGKIYSLFEIAEPTPPLHSNCRCIIEPMKSIIAGFGTKDGINGADWWIKHHGKLPDYYITMDALYDLGYGWGKVPRKYAPGKMVTQGIFQNDKKLHTRCVRAHLV